MKKKVNIIGSGFSSLSAACYLAQAGYEVEVFEKNKSIGGRARQFSEKGFTFDMGPSWYWMPDVFERFFADFDKKPSDYYELMKLSPAYEINFGENQKMTIGDNLDKIYEAFENEEPGAAAKLRSFIEKAKENYEIAIKDIVYRPGVSPLELVTPQTVTKLSRFFGTLSNDVRKLFKNKRLVQALEFPVLFLGAKPSATPAFYSFMNFADFGLGTWHPKGGMFEIIDAMAKLATSLGVKIHTSATVQRIEVNNGKATGLAVDDEIIPADFTLSGADYHHTETLLPQSHRQYSEDYWQRKTFAPSSLLFFLGFDKKIESVQHHNLFFDTDFDQHAASIYDHPQWPNEPLFYASFPSKSDESMAPPNQDSAMFLVPLAPGIEDSQALRDETFKKVINRFNDITGQDIERHISYKREFCLDDFKRDYNSYKGNAYGLANTLMQTAFLRPNLKSSKLKDLYFTGQLTVPGPGVPPALISGKLAAGLIEKNNKNK